MFSVDIPSTMHSILRERFIKEPVFIEAVDALLGITGHLRKASVVGPNTALKDISLKMENFGVWEVQPQLALSLVRNALPNWRLYSLPGRSMQKCTWAAITSELNSSIRSIAHF